MKRSLPIALTLLFLLQVQSFVPHASAWCQLTSSTIKPTAAEPCILAENHPGAVDLAWSRRCTALSFSDAAPPRSMSIEALTPIFRAALDQWEQADCGGGRRTGLHTEILPLRNQCIESSYFVNGRNVSSVMFVQSGWTSARQHDARAYAVTLVWHDPRTGEILDGDMELNEERSIGGQLINYGVCPDSGCTGSTVDLRNIVTHELGHYFGLAHTPDDREATMWESAEPNEVKKRDLQPDDVAGICGIYPAGDLTGACDITPDNGLGLSCSTSGTNCDSNGLGSNGFACSSSCTRPDDFSIACAGAAASRPAYCGSVSNLGGTPCASTKKCGCRIQDRASEPGTLFASMSFAFLAFVFLRKQKRR